LLCILSFLYSVCCIEGVRIYSNGSADRQQALNAPYAADGVTVSNTDESKSSILIVPEYCYMRILQNVDVDNDEIVVISEIYKAFINACSLHQHKIADPATVTQVW
jgi:hypothetical protein